MVLREKGTTSTMGGLGSGERGRGGRSRGAARATSETVEALLAETQDKCKGGHRPDDDAWADGAAETLAKSKSDNVSDDGLADGALHAETQGKCTDGHRADDADAALGENARMLVLANGGSGGARKGSVHQKRGLGGEAGKAGTSASVHQRVGLGGAGTSEGTGEWGAGAGEARE